MNAKQWRRVALGLVLAGAVMNGEAVPREWTGGAGTPDWFTAANWSPADAAPQPGDAIIIANGAAVLLAANTPMLGSFAITNATLTFTNWNTTLRATNVFIRQSALLTLPAPFRAVAGEMTNNLTIVCTNLTLDAGAVIDVSGKGYNYSDGPGKGTDGPYSGGGAHGGRGGNGFNIIMTANRGGLPNDDWTAPILPGSGGGSYQTASPANRGGAGGGALRIDAAGICTLNGSISANGDVSQHASGGGAGGSVYITCGRLAGGTNGLVEASGGAVKNVGGGGSGGRIAVMYRDLDGLPCIRFHAAAGKGTYWRDWDQHWLHAAEPGTLALPDARLLSPLLTGGQFRDVRLDIGASAWATPSLVVSNCSLTFVRPGFALEVSNDLVVAAGHLGVGWTNATGLARIDVGGDLVLASGGALYLYSGATNGTPRDYGACLSVTGDVQIGAEAWIYPYARGSDDSAPLFTVGSLCVQAGGGFNANAAGYRESLGPGKGGGPGAYCAGAGHGGKGGRGSATTYLEGKTYGSTNAPLTPGSGGGNYWSDARVGGRGGTGGGVIRIVAAREARVDGTLTAAGGVSEHVSGGGSGGTIFLACGSFAGGSDARLDVGGGTGWNWSNPDSPVSGGGGGGRIAVAVGFSENDLENLIAGAMIERLTVSPAHRDFAGTISVTNGVGYFMPPDPYGAESGTWTFLRIVPPPGTVMMIR